MPSDKKPPKRLRKLTEFIAKEKGIVEGGQQGSDEKKPGTSSTTREVLSSSEQEKSASYVSQAIDISDELILQLLSRMEQAERKPETFMTSERKSEEKEASLAKDESIQEMVDQLIKDEIKIVECSSSRMCNDGIKVGDIFVDSHGIKRQRGYLKTTRIPIYVDVIVETGSVKQIPALKKTYVVTTSRGARAIVPEEFLCELEERYGVILEGYNCEKTGLLGGLDVASKKMQS